MKYHAYLFIALFTFCNLLGGDFPEQPENLSADNARQAKRKANRKARYKREKQKREEGPELLAQHKEYHKRENQKRKEDPELLAQRKEYYKKEYYKREKQKREENPELLAQRKEYYKARYERKKQKREKGLEATTPSEEFYSFFSPQNLEEENLPIKSLEELNREWLKNQLDDLSDSPKPKLYPSWDDLLSDEEK